MNKKNIAFIVIVALIFGGLTLGVVALKKWNQPLGESLNLPTVTPESSEPDPTDSTLVAALDSTTPAEPSPTPPPEATSLPTNTPTLIATATPAPLCGGPSQMIVLALGIDSRADSYLYGLADVIKIVRVDFTIPKVTVMSMPRDLWVEIPEIEDYGITEGKLNQSYFYGTDGMGYYEGPGGAPGLTARTLQQNFGLTVDHYGSVNMRTFERMVDAVDGIDLYLPTDVDGRPVDDKTDDMGYFYAGVNHFNGNAALRFSRIRKTDTVFDRMDRQTMVLCALRDKLLQPSVITQIPELIGAFEGSIVTDLSPAEMSQLACLLPKLSNENIVFGGIPEEELTMGRQWDPRLGNYTFVWQIEYDLIRDYITQFENGTWPVSQGDSGSCPPPVKVE